MRTTITTFADSPDRGERLVLAPAGALAVAFVGMLERERRQPGFAAHGPQLVGRRHLVGGVERAEAHLDLVAAAAEHRRAAVGAEVATTIVTRLAFGCHGVGGKDRGGVEQRSGVLAAVEAVAQADAIRLTRRQDADLAAQTPAGETLHASGARVADRVLVI